MMSTYETATIKFLEVASIVTLLLFIFVLPAMAEKPESSALKITLPTAAEATKVIELEKVAEVE